VAEVKDLEYPPKQHQLREQMASLETQKELVMPKEFKAHQFNNNLRGVTLQ
jgi:hypothetical protein